MGRLISGVIGLHNAVFGGLQRALDGWALGLGARLAFASVLLLYFWNSALTKVINARTGATGPLDYLTVEGNSLAQMAPKAFEAAGYDPSAMGVQYWLMAYGGTYAEFVLPALVVVGLFTRLASLGMIGFIAVQSWVDVTGHGATASISEAFDRLPDAIIVDQRLLWIFPLLYLVIRGGGMVSLDRAFGRTDFTREY